MSDRCETCGQSTSYNGWKNYETWLVGLWLSNEQKTDTHTRRIVAKYGVFQAADRLKEHYGDRSEAVMMPAHETGMYCDLLNAALSNVDWIEVARHFKPDEWGEHDGRPVTYEQLDHIAHGHGLSTSGFAWSDYMSLARDLGCVIIEE